MIFECVSCERVLGALGTRKKKEGKRKEAARTQPSRYLFSELTCEWFCDGRGTSLVIQVVFDDRLHILRSFRVALERQVGGVQKYMNSAMHTSRYEGFLFGTVVICVIM